VSEDRLQVVVDKLMGLRLANAEEKYR